jgi:hypothetical protein
LFAAQPISALGDRLVPVALAFAVAVTPAMMALLAAHAPLPLILALALIDGSAGTMFNTFWFTSMQSEIPCGEQARVFSWDYLGSTAMLPVGQALSGPVAARLGSRRRSTAPRE